MSYRDLHRTANADFNEREFVSNKISLLPSYSVYYIRLEKTKLTVKVKETMKNEKEKIKITSEETTIE